MNKIDKDPKFYLGKFEDAEDALDFLGILYSDSEYPYKVLCEEELNGGITGFNFEVDENDYIHLFRKSTASPY